MLMMTCKEERSIIKSLSTYRTTNSLTSVYHLTR